jgi:hypothetical protein
VTARRERGREELETRVWDRKAGEGKDSYDRTARTGQHHRIATSGARTGQDVQNMTARAVQDGSRDKQVRTARTGKKRTERRTRQDSWERTTRTVLHKQYNRDSTTRSGQPEKDSHDRTTRTGHPVQDSQNWTARTIQGGKSMPGVDRTKGTR